MRSGEAVGCRATAAAAEANWALAAAFCDGERLSCIPAAALASRALAADSCTWLLSSLGADESGGGGGTSVFVPRPRPALVACAAFLPAAARLTAGFTGAELARASCAAMVDPVCGAGPVSDGAAAAVGTGTAAAGRGGSAAGAAAAPLPQEPPARLGHSWSLDGSPGGRGGGVSAGVPGAAKTAAHEVPPPTLLPADAVGESPPPPAWLPTEMVATGLPDDAGMVTARCRAPVPGGPGGATGWLADGVAAAGCAAGPGPPRPLAGSCVMAANLLNAGFEASASIASFVKLSASSAATRQSALN